MKIKDKHWKYATIILMIVGIASLFLSNVTAFPSEMPVDSTYNTIRNPELKNFDSIKNAYIITDFDPDELDQVQDSLAVYYKIGVEGWGCPILQPVANNREPMTGFVVAIGKHGSPSSALYMGIMYPFTYPCNNNPYDGQNYIIAGAVEVDDVPQDDHFYWFGIDFSDYPKDVLSGPPPLGIVLFSTDDTTDGNYWMWGAGTGNPYTAYQPTGWADNRNEWMESMLLEGADHDMCFATYTTSGGGGDVPVITITTTSWVTANIGVACLIGAAISGCKYASMIL
jgi:hypothetical protein